MIFYVGVKHCTDVAKSLKSLQSYTIVQKWCTYLVLKYYGSIIQIDKVLKAAIH